MKFADILLVVFGLGCVFVAAWIAGWPWGWLCVGIAGWCVWWKAKKY